MRWYVSHDPICFLKCPNILHVCDDDGSVYFLRKGRVVQWELCHTCAHVSCILCCFTRGRVHFRFPCRCFFFFCRLLIPLSCLRCTWSDFIFTTVPFSVWDTFGEHSYVTTSCCVCVPCHFPNFLCVSLRPWPNWCAAGSPFGFCMVTTSRNPIPTFRNSETFSWWMSRPTETLASRCCFFFSFYPFSVFFSLLACLFSFSQFFFGTTKQLKRK